MKDYETNNLERLQELALSLGVDIDGDEKALETAIKVKLGEFGYINETEQVSSERREGQAAHTLSAIMAGDIEVAGMTDFAGKYKKNQLPNLMPREIPWGGRKMRMKRIRQNEDDLVGLILQWNGSRFLFPLECEYADVPWPHYLIMMNAKGKRLKQHRRQMEDGRIEYVDDWVEVTSYPVMEMGVTPGTEDLPRGMKEYIYEMYIEGFPGFTNGMWRQLCLAYDFSDKHLGIKPSMPFEEQLNTRRMTLFDRLGLVDLGDDPSNRIERAEAVRELIDGTPLAAVA